MCSLEDAVAKLEEAISARHAPFPDELTGAKRKKYRSKLNSKVNNARANVDAILATIDYKTATGLAKQLLDKRKSTVERLRKEEENAKQRLHILQEESKKFRREYIRKQRAEESPFKEALKQSARVARAMGFQVRASKSDGLISSYYISPKGSEAIERFGDGYAMRLSDHELPINHKRDTGYVGKEIIVDDIVDNETFRKVIEQVWTGKLPSGNLTDLVE